MSYSSRVWQPDLYLSRYERAAKEQDCLTMAQATRRLGVTALTLRNWSAAGRIAVVRSPAGWRMIPRSEMARAFSLLDHRRGRRGRAWDHPAEPKVERSMKVATL